MLEAGGWKQEVIVVFLESMFVVWWVCILGLKS